MPKDDEVLELEEQEELDISDDDNEEPGEQEEAPDRGDVVIDPEAEPEADADPEADAEPEADPEKDPEEDPDSDEEDEEGQKVPMGRFNKLNDRMKRAEAELVRRDEEDIARGARTKAAKDEDEEEKEDLPSSDELWESYHEKNELGDFDEAKEVLADIRKAQARETKELVQESIQTDRADREFESARKAATETAVLLKKQHPELLDTASDVYQQFTIFADGLYKSGKTMSASLTQAAKVFFGEVKTEKVEEDEEEIIKDTAADRKRAAILKNAKAAKQQPAPLDKGTGQGQGKVNEKKKIKDLTEEEFDALDDKQKDRGDKV